MDVSDQRRKRKRIPSRKFYPLSKPPLLSVRSFVLCLSSFIFLYLLSSAISLKSSGYRPVLVVSSLSLLSSATTRTVKSVQDFGGGLFPQLKIEGRVLFPDHVLLLVRGVNVDRNNKGLKDCVYYRESGDGFRAGFVKKKVLSVDEWDGFRSIVRCPIPPSNYSNVVNLGGNQNRVLVSNLTVHSWDNLAYSATLDGDDSVVVFVKGLNLRPDRESDPRTFTCHFGSSSLGQNQRFQASTKALSAAQEVVRCALPRSIRDNNPGKALQGISVTVGATPRGPRDNRRVIIIPSVARISNPAGPNQGKKHDLCVCTMLWNQASAIREWIVYHSWLGVGRWFVYDNNSDDWINDEIFNLVADGHNVTRHSWPWIKTQEAGFSHCALRARDECRWVSFMDVDEYFYLPHSLPGHHEHFRPSGYASRGALRALVANVSSSSDRIAEIRTSCHSFGPSGLTRRPPKGVTVGYTCRLQSPERHKSIIRPEALDRTLLNVVHHFHLGKGFEYVNLPQSTAVINHYKYQVWDVFRAKFHRRVATYVADWQENQNEGSRDRAPGLGTEAVEPPDWPRKFCEVWDTGLRDFLLGNMMDATTGLLPWEYGSQQGSGLVD